MMPIAPRVDAALRLAVGKEHANGAGRSPFFRFESEIRATGKGMKALEESSNGSAGVFFGNMAFSGSGLYEFCEQRCITFFTELSSNSSFEKIIQAHLKHPPVHPSKQGIKGGGVDFHWQPEKWNKPGRIVCKIECRMGELFPRVEIIVTDSNVEAHKVISIPNDRAAIEDRIEEGRNTPRRDKTSCRRFAANEAGFPAGCLACNLPHTVRDAAFRGGNTEPSTGSIIAAAVEKLIAATVSSRHQLCCV